MSNKGESFFAGVILGAAVGAVTALLFAPDKGKRTRKKLNRKVRELNDAMDEVYLKSKDSFTHLSEDVEDNINDLAKKGKKILAGK
ncbi:YtxH domain-containing protein [Chondrinema litorale]|uniref:YtxH domain-containing protein n=1 Tax=Chondrinema litorale TaxID=2994555 RepID=UPI002542F5CE|nr:YtxH domain-containing protein [Chondrinema litorale]UZR94474.1 YtxH domain-containing protein [Chondrinema litorale]